MSTQSFFMRWTEDDIDGLSAMGVAEMFTEVRSDGLVTREVGVNPNGVVVYRSPNLSNSYGLFDNTPIARESLRNDLSRDAFESLWAEKPVRK